MQHQRLEGAWHFLPSCLDPGKGQTDDGQVKKVKKTNTKHVSPTLSLTVLIATSPIGNPINIIFSTPVRPTCEDDR